MARRRQLHISRHARLCACVRVHYIIARYAGETPRPDASSIEQAVTRIVLTWQDRLSIELTAARHPSEARRLLERTAGLAWRDIALIRTFSRYLRQVGIPYSQDYMWATLTKYGSIAEKIVALFYARFEPRPEMPASSAWP